MCSRIKKSAKVYYTFKLIVSIHNKHKYIIKFQIQHHYYSKNCLKIIIAHKLQQLIILTAHTKKSIAKKTDYMIEIYLKK